LRPEILKENEPENAEPSRMEYYVNELKKAAPSLWENNMKIVTEFGQWSYFYSGFVYSQVEYALQRGHTNVVYVHVGADMFLRDVYTGKGRGIDFVPLIDDVDVTSSTANAVPMTTTDIAGPLCFAGDYLQQQAQFPTLKEGDELLLLNTGSNAYGLWSRHCSRTIPKVIGVDVESQIVFPMSPRRNPFVNDESAKNGVLLPWKTSTTSDEEAAGDDHHEEEVAAS